MTAKEMFEELGYIQINNSLSNITYQRLNTLKPTIEFNVDRIGENTFIKYIRVYSDDECYSPISLNMEELQAINKQVEELGWK